MAPGIPMYCHAADNSPQYLIIGKSTSSNSFTCYINNSSYTIKPNSNAEIYYKYNGTDPVIKTGYMFSDCSGLTALDLSNFDTSNMTNMKSMFYCCSGLANIKCKAAFRERCITNAETSELPEAFKDADYEGWEIVD